MTSYDIWFVPTNSSHIAKLKAFMDGLCDRGHRVRVACVDALQFPIYAARPSIEKSGYPLDAVPPGRFRPTAFWRSQPWWRGRLIEAIDAFLEGRRIDALVFGADTGFVSRTFVQTAVRRGIPTALVPDGLVLPPNPHYHRPLAARIRSGVVKALQRLLRVEQPRGMSGVDLILCMNETARDAFLLAGVPEDRLTVVGSSEYDALACALAARDWTEDNRRLREVLGLPPTGPIVFFAHQGVIYDRQTARALVRMMVESCRRCGAALLVKFHPRRKEWLQEWRQWAAAEGMGEREVVFVRDECTSVEASRLCDVCITFFSTVALEALVCRKSLILIQYVNAPFEFNLGRKYGAAIEAHDPENLKKAIVSVVSDASRREVLVQNIDKALGKELCGLDGKATERAIAAVVDLIRRRQARREPPR